MAKTESGKNLGNAQKREVLFTLPRIIFFATGMADGTCRNSHSARSCSDARLFGLHNVWRLRLKSAELLKARAC